MESKKPDVAHQGQDIQKNIAAPELNHQRISIRLSV
jgi:hypothetical protein